MTPKLFIYSFKFNLDEITIGQNKLNTIYVAAHMIKLSEDETTPGALVDGKATTPGWVVHSPRAGICDTLLPIN